MKVAFDTHIICIVSIALGLYLILLVSARLGHQLNIHMILQHEFRQPQYVSKEILWCAMLTYEP